MSDWRAFDRMLPAIVGLVFLSLALIKGVKYMKYPAFGGVRLVKILIEDQAFYYAMCVSSRIKVRTSLISYLAHFRVAS